MPANGRIVVDVTHPAHFHFFRPAIERWRQEGRDVIIAARDKDLTLSLLESHGYAYRLLSRARRGLAGLARELLEHETRLLRLLRQTRPDVVVEVAGTFIVHAAFVARVPALVFYDTEHARLSNAITYPFATRIITPQCYEGDLGPRQVRYAGYQELAYLHPAYFEPDPALLRRSGIEPEEPYFLLRFVSWEASHDHGHSGFSHEDKLALVDRLRPHGRVLISSETALPPALADFAIRLPPHHVHHLLAFATLYVGESATMASEAALLGTPSIYVSTLPRGYINEQQDCYQLSYWYPQPQEALDHAERLAIDPQAGPRWARRRQQMLAEKEDVTDFVCQQVESYLSTIDVKHRYEHKSHER